MQIRQLMFIFFKAKQIKLEEIWIVYSVNYNYSVIRKHVDLQLNIN